MVQPGHQPAVLTGFTPVICGSLPNWLRKSLVPIEYPVNCGVTTSFALFSSRRIWKEPRRTPMRENCCCLKYNRRVLTESEREAEKKIKREECFKEKESMADIPPLRPLGLEECATPNSFRYKTVRFLAHHSWPAKMSSCVN